MDNGCPCINEVDASLTPALEEGCGQNIQADENRETLRFFPGITFASAVATQRDPVRFA